MRKPPLPEPCITPVLGGCSPRRALCDRRCVSHLQQIGNLMSLFASSEDSAPATGSESNVYFLSIPAAKSCQKSGPAPSTWCPKSPDDFKTPFLGFSTVMVLAVCVCTTINYLNHPDDGQFCKPGTYKLYDFVYALVHYTCPNKG